jgi:hypothetical protein
MCVRELYILFVNYNRSRLTLCSYKKNLNVLLLLKKKVFKTITRITRFRESFFKIEQQQKKMF